MDTQTLGIPSKETRAVMNCRQCKRAHGAYAMLFVDEEPFILGDRHCLRAWLASHPEEQDWEGAPE